MREPKLPAKIRYPIGVKLIVIVSAIAAVSLGAITALVSWMVTRDIQLQAEENNFALNTRSAADAEETLIRMKSGGNVLLNALEISRNGGGMGENNAWFFDEYRELGAVAEFLPSGDLSALYTSESFFSDNELDIPGFKNWLAEGSAFAARAAAGETMIRGGIPAGGAALLAMFYPRGSGAAMVLFSSERLADSFGTGVNTTYLINGEGDLLVHPDAELAKAAANIRNRRFIRSVLENGQANMQTLYTDEEGVQFLGAYTKLSEGGAVLVTAVEYGRLLEGIHATTRRNIYLTAAVLLLAGILIWGFSKNISRPLRGLTRAAEGIEGGEFDVELRAATRDEIGALTESFGKMSKALGIFGRFTNREIALRAMRGEIKPGGLPKQATVFFSDIRGFTEKSENFVKEFGPEASDRIVHWLNDYFTRMVECIEKTGGVVDKFIGDAVMAHWGTAYTAGSPEKDAYQCVKAALLMRRALVEMNRGRKKDDRGQPPITIGCGINSGIVTAGQIGSEARMEYTVIGDPVNLASRTEALNKPFGTDILITEHTWNLAGKYFITEEMPPVRVKGKEKPERLFAVVNFRGKPGEAVKGPQTLKELREYLGIAEPDLSQIDTSAEEKKYSIGEAGRG